MGDLRYTLTIVITLMEGYFNRDDEFGPLLGRFNDDFPMEAEIDFRIRTVLDFIEECGFSPKSRVWRKADLFTLIVELDQALSLKTQKLQPGDTVEKLEDFYKRIDSTSLGLAGVAAIYYKAALQATNDRLNRVRRGTIIGGILLKFTDDTIFAELKARGLLE